MRDVLPIDEILRILGTTPARIAEATTGFSPDLLTTRPDATAWSVNEVLAHLRSCADVWGDCIALLLAEDHPTVRAVNPRQWIKRTDYREQPFEANLQAFTHQREELLPVLAGLTLQRWARTATVRGAGSPLEKDVLSFANRMALHERAHVGHIARTVRAVQALPG
jgi:hypothetical protein